MKLLVVERSRKVKKGDGTCILGRMEWDGDRESEPSRDMKETQY